MKIIGILLIVLGGLGLYFRAVPYKENVKVVDVGPLHASADVDKSFPVPPWASGGVLALGVLLLVMPNGRKRR